MNRRKIKILGVFCVMFMLITTSLFAQKGEISGRLTDATNGEPLPYANVAIMGTTNGTVTDDEGLYLLGNIEPGEHVLVFSYLSYETKEHKVVIKAGETLEMNDALNMLAIMGEEVVVTAMLRGQSGAINKQVKASTIVNVVSKEKIMELPDQNAAETVGRLPGVSLVRDGGEGTKVTLRGLAPRFNSITIDGEKVPSTDDQDRSVDLSMFSTDALSGIEFYKALMPDMDGDAIGGSINFISRTASSGFNGSAKVQTGYNDLVKQFGQYKGSLSLENRFFNDRLGIIVGGSMQKADRSREGFTGEYASELGVDGNENTVFKVSKLNVTDIRETRYRYNANTTIDLKLDNGKIIFSSNFGQTDREEVRRRRRYRVDASYQEHDFRERHSTNMVISNRLNGRHKFFDRLEFDWSGSYSFSRNYKPFVSTMRFRERSAFIANDEDTYADIIAGAKNNMDATWLKDAYFDTYDVRDNNYSAQANFKLPFNIGENISGYVKTGGKYRSKYRVNDIHRIWTEHFVAQEIIDDNRQDPDWVINYTENYILMENFLGDYTNDDFMRHYEEPFYLGPGTSEVNGPHIDEGLVESFRKEYYDYYVDDPLKDLSDYEAGEKISAAYLMSSFSFYNKVDLIAGVRYERTNNSYSSTFGTPQVDEDGNVINMTGLVDTVGVRQLEEFLPMFHLKYSINDWSNFRLAATKSLNRPNFFSLVPWERVNRGEEIAERGEPNLEHMTAWNYDAILSFYGRFGLVSFGGFYKEIKNIDYTLTSRVYDPSDPINGLSLTRPVNADGLSTILGFEIDLQSNFRFLPAPFNGIIVSANYTHLTSETQYPTSLVKTLDVFPYTSTVIDTTRSGSMPGQVNDLVNMSIGYEKGGFSARVSMVYQGESLFVGEEVLMGELAKSIGATPEKDNYVGATTRWDLVIKQSFKNDLQIFLYVNNLTNVREETFLAGSSRRLITSSFAYGRTVDIGMRYKF